VTASSLFDAVVSAQGVRVHSARRGLDAPLEREFEGIRALLAEDNEANQMVALELLGRLGIALDVARNGREAIEMAQAAPSQYAAILMDMQMPELDGLSATRALRADPRFATIPIIAMTANAMKVDLDACLAAGMNDHITKPIDRRALVATLRRWLPEGSRAPVAVPELPRVDDHEPALEGLDMSGTVQRLGIDRATLERMLLRFADGQAELLQALRAAVATGDGAAAGRHAHAIAGAAGNLGAEGLRTAAKALEQAGREGRQDLTALLAAVEEHVATVFRSIETLRPPAPPKAATVAEPVGGEDEGAALDRLIAALDGYDVSAATEALACLNTSGLRLSSADDLDGLSRSIDGYEYAEARRLASRLADRLHAART
jgi:two-component system, sensor histidine kinase and response regulator